MTWILVGLAFLIPSLTVVVVGCREAIQRERLLHEAIEAEVERLAEKKRTQEKERRVYGRMINDLASGHCMRVYWHRPEGWRIYAQQPSTVVPLADLDPVTQEVIRQCQS